MWRFVILVCLLFRSLVSSAQEARLYEKKLSYSLRQVAQPGSRDSCIVSVRMNKEISNSLFPPSSRILKHISPGTFILSLKKNELIQLASLTDVLFINEYHTAHEELSSGASDPTLNTINYTHTRFPDLTGDSLNASIKERLFDTTDIDLKGRVFLTGWESGFQTAHASLMATIIAGAANSSPVADGVAQKSHVSPASFDRLFPEPDSVFIKNKISVQNHSYGTAVENFYGNEAEAYDEQVSRIPLLLHVFSAGNSGNVTPANGPYAGVSSFANLTGNFKQSKNILTVGSLDSARQLLPLSSKGPAYDGRIKPELMAYGEDGSSGAAALVSGASLLVQDAYKKNYHVIPASSLIKSVLINSADDVGPLHPDYYSGFGNLDTYKAISTIVQSRFAEGNVTQGQVKNFTLAIPAGISQVKITLVWNDLPAAPNAAKALINDLDLVLENVVTTETWKPWVLDPSPGIAALTSPAQRKTDTLNNVEQVTLDFPVAGNYNIKISGSKVTGLQSFSLAWQLDTINQFYWTYPSAGDHLTAGNKHLLRWNTQLTGNTTIEYATSGNNWRQVATNVDISDKYVQWTVPDTTTTAQLRITTSAGIFLSDTFTINRQPDLETGFNCTDSFLLYWKHTPPGVYRLYELGSERLVPVLQTTDTAIILYRLQHPSIYYAVAPVINGKEGLKSVTVNYTSQGVGCYLKTFFNDSHTGSTAGFRAELGSTFGLTDLLFEKLTTAGWQTIQQIHNPVDLVYHFTDAPLHAGENHYRLGLKLSNGTILYSQVEVVYHLGDSPVFIYPNPVQQNDLLHIISNEAGRYQLQVFDAQGRLMFDQVLNSNILKFNSGFLGKGMYWCRILDKKGKAFTSKVIVF